MAIIYVCRFQLYYGTIILKMTLPREKGFGAPEWVIVLVTTNIYTAFKWLIKHFSLSSVQSLSRVRLFGTPWTAARQASLSITNSQSPPKPMSIELVIPSNHLILCRPLHLLPSISPSIRVFSTESTLCIRWPKYWSFSFNTSPSNEHPGLISFRMDWLDLLAIQGTLKSVFQHHTSKASILQCSAFFIVQLSHPYMTTEKTITLTRRTFVGKVMSLLFNMLSRLVITFLLRSKRLLISWLQSPFAVIWGPRKIKSATVSTVSPSICHEVMPFFIPKSRKRQDASLNGTRKWCIIYWCQLIGRYLRSALGLQLFSLTEKKDSLGSSPRNKETWPLGQGLLVDKWDTLSSIVTYFFVGLLRAFNMFVCIVTSPRWGRVHVSHTYFIMEKCLRLMFLGTQFGKYWSRGWVPWTRATKKWNQRVLQRGKEAGDLSRMVRTP